MSAAAAVHEDVEGAVRTLRKVDVREGATGRGGPFADGIAAVVDVETTGRDPASDAIVELAVRRFRYDAAGEIVKVDRGYSWLEDPGVPLEPEIVRVTGLTDADLAGREIDDGAAVRLLSSASIVLAHNAAFDRRFVERRLPDAAGLPWACSMAEVPWLELGFDGRSLGYLLTQRGLFHAGHRAAADVDAVIALMACDDGAGRPLLSHLVDSAMSDSWDVRAVGAPFAVKDALRARGYRWDAADRVWHRAVSDRDRQREEWWLAAQVYGGGLASRLGPEVRRLERFVRYA